MCDYKANRLRTYIPRLVPITGSELKSVICAKGSTLSEGAYTITNSIGTVPSTPESYAQGFGLY
jgi:hypothetical protein